MEEPIRLKCAHCGAGLKAPATVAGKTLECPKCHQPIQVPALVPDAELIDLAAEEVDSVPTPSPLQKSPLDSKQCPHCHAQIPAAASKCRQCGEFVHAAKVTAGDDSKMHPVEYAVAVLLAPVGLGIGVIWAIQKLRKAGPMLMISAPMTVLLAAGVLSYYVFYNPGDNWATPEPDLEAMFPDGLPSAGGSGTPDRVPPTEKSSIAGTPDLNRLKEQPEETQRPLRANVRIDVSGRMLGSGIVVKIEQNVALMLTNRHVVDELHARTRGQQSTQLADLPSVNVTYVTGEKEPGKVIWLATDGIDLAVVRAFCPAEGVQTATWQVPPTVKQGESVFAVGNPAGLGWTLTRGTVSALRQHNIGQREIPVIQTDTAINPGNSGGGLYTAAGKLVGINNFIIDPTRAQRVGFAIDFGLLSELSSKPFEL